MPEKSVTAVDWRTVELTALSQAWVPLTRHSHKMSKRLVLGRTVSMGEQPLSC